MYPQQYRTPTGQHDIALDIMSIQVRGFDMYSYNTCMRSLIQQFCFVFQHPNKTKSFRRPTSN